MPFLWIPKPPRNAPTVLFMTDPLVPVLTEALRSAMHYIENRTDDNTSDDDLRALEDVSDLLQRVGPADRDRLVTALGPDLGGWFDDVADA